MRLRCIRIRNLASLAGTQPPIRLGPDGLEGGLVAITGATGAGKSTILDAICLALFGRTPRTELPARTDTAGRQVGNLLTRGAEDGFAEVEVEDRNGRLLRSRWSIARARTGTLQPPQMSLIDCRDGRVIADKKSAVVPAIEAAIGLDFNQFDGVVVLSQGSFSAFLRGRKEDRSQLLERLTGTAIYGDLSRAAHCDAQAKAQAVAELEARLGDVSVLDGEARAACEAELAQASATAERCSARLDAAQRHEQQLASLRSHMAELASAEADLRHAQTAAAALEPERQRLARARQAAPLRLPLDRLQAAETRLREADAARSTAERAAIASRATAAGQWQTCLRELGTLRATLQGLQTELERRSAARHATPQRLTELRRDHAQCHRSAAAIAATVDDLAQRRRQADTLAATLAGQQAEEAAARTSLADAEQALRTAEQELQAQLETHGDEAGLAARIAALDRLADLQDSALRHAREADGLALRREQEAQDLAKAEADLAGAEQRLEERQAAVAAAEAIRDQARAIADLADHRHRLRPGAPCPLCLQTVQDLPEAPVASALRSAEATCAEQRDRLQQSEGAIADAHRRMDLAKGRLEELGQRRTAVDRLRREVDELIVNSKGVAGWSSDDPIDLQTLSSQREQLTGLLQHHRTLRQRSSSATAAVDAARQQVEAVAAAARTTVESLARHNAGLAERERQLDQDRQELGRAEQARDRTVAALASDCGCPPPTIAQLVHWLDDRQRDHEAWARISQAVQDLAPVISDLTDEILAAAPAGSSIPEAEARAVSAEALHLRLQNARSCWRDTRHAEEAAQRSRSTSEQATAAQRQAAGDCEACRQVVAEALQAAGIADRASASSWMLAEADQTALDLRLTEAGNTVRVAADHRDRLVASIAAQRRELGDLTDEPEALAAACDAAAAAVRQARSERDACTADRARLEARLAEDDRQRQRDATLRDSLAAHRRDHLLAEELKDLIGHHAGERFREYAQSLTLEQLVHYANHRLTRFAPRYRLVARDGLQLDVIDQQMADERRPTSTLSGGESFLVSLGLALGLADFKRGTGSIGSVFIDEGFGSLDRDALELALGALEQVQGDLDAQVVVISHVGELDNRWTDSINVRGLGQGRAWLMVPGQPGQPPRPQLDSSAWQPPIDTGAIADFLAASGGKRTRKAIAAALGCANDQRLSEALAADARFVLDGRSWRLASEPDPSTD